MPGLPAGVSVGVKVLNSGWVTARKGMVVEGAGNEEIRMPALFAVLRHPEHGVVLYDTGYHTRFFEVTGKFPYRVLRAVTPVERDEDDDAARRLEREGISPEEVKTAIISHGHVDHVPGLVDFPAAFFPHRACTSPFFKSKWHFLRASTPGNDLSMPSITSKLSPMHVPHR